MPEKAPHTNEFSTSRGQEANGIIMKHDDGTDSKGQKNLLDRRQNQQTRNPTFRGIDGLKGSVFFQSGE